MKLGVDNKQIFSRQTNQWQANNSLMNDKWVKEETKKEKKIWN